MIVSSLYVLGNGRSPAGSGYGFGRRDACGAPRDRRTERASVRIAFRHAARAEAALGEYLAKHVPPVCRVRQGGDDALPARPG